MSFYQYSMRNASRILFWASLALFIVTIVWHFGVHMQGFQSGDGDFSLSSNQDPVWIIMSSLVNGLSNAAWPFFGAALLHMLDQKLLEAAE